MEDAAQAHGARIGGRAAGSFGIGCFSLYATKNMMAGEGGLITTDDDEIADRLRLLRNQGMRARYQYEMAGHNFRMTELQAAVAVGQLARLREQHRRRAGTQCAGAHRTAARRCGTRAAPECRPGRGHVFHQYTVRVTEGARLTGMNWPNGSLPRRVLRGLLPAASCTTTSYRATAA